MVSFQSLNLSEPVLRALADMGFENPSPIQADALPAILDGRDVIGQARTGTGKTAAFGIPAVESAAADGRVTLVLVPTRELAQQVAAEVDRIGKHAGVSAIAIYGGAPFGSQAMALKRGRAKVIVATPGRLRDHAERGTLDLASAGLVVLDEVDEMLKVGFLEEVEEILAAIPDRQTLLFSATLPDPIARLAKRHLANPVTIRAVDDGAEDEGVAGGSTEQFAVAVRHHEKLDALIRIIAVERPTGVLAFRHTRDTVDSLVSELRQRGVAAEALHGGMPQQSRDAVVERLRDGRIRVLVATSVAARGLDVDRLSHVVNYDAPAETDAYVHRIGRTGRAGRSGRAFLFVTPSDRGRLRGIERAINDRLPWFEVPTDEDVASAVQQNLVTWATEQAADEKGLGRFNAAVDAAVAAGVDLRAMAAAALRVASKHEGLVPPALEQRRDSRGAPQGQGAPVGGPLVPMAFGVGWDDGVRPGDLVGALANEGGLVGADVGRIDILPRMSVAEVPQSRADAVIAAMDGSVIRGRSVTPRIADGWTFRERQPKPAQHASSGPRHTGPRKFGPRKGGPRARWA